MRDVTTDRMQIMRNTELKKKKGEESCLDGSKYINTFTVL